MCDARVWTEVAAILGRSGCRSQVAAYGGGRSIADFASQALAEAPERCVVVGHSMGAIVAMDMARQAKDRIAGVCLACTNLGADLPERSQARVRQVESAHAGGFQELVVDQLKPAYLGEGASERPEVRRLVWQMAVDAGADRFDRESEALRLRPDLRPELGKLDVPVLVLCAANDTLCPTGWHEDMARLARRSRFEVLAACGHMAPLERPEAFASAVATWMTREFGA